MRCNLPPGRIVVHASWSPRSHPRTGLAKPLTLEAIWRMRSDELAPTLFKQDAFGLMMALLRYDNIEVQVQQPNTV